MRLVEKKSRWHQLAGRGLLRAGVSLCCGGLIAFSVSAQDASSFPSTSEAGFDATPQTRMRPIGERSLVDEFPQQRSWQETAAPDRLEWREETSRDFKAGDRAATDNTVRYAARQTLNDPPSLGGVRASAFSSSAETGYYPVRQTVFQSPSGDSVNSAPALPGDPNAGGSMGMPSTSTPLPGTTANANQFTPRNSMPPGTVLDSSPVPVPRIDDGMATIDNCNCVSAPSSYTAGGYWGCDSMAATPVSYAPPPSYVGPPTMVSPPLAGPVVPPTYIPNNAGYRPLFTLGQDTYNAQLGRGIIGQPTAYVPGQPVRNFLRYLSP